MASEPSIPDYREGTVYLFNGAKFIAIEPNRPAIIPRMAFMVALLILKLPGTQAETRSKNPTPYLLIGGKTVGGHLVHFSIDSAPADPHRETRLKSELEITASDLVNFKDEKLESGWHKISAYHPLAPGEYAWIPYLSNGAGLMGVIDFGVDKP